MGDVTDVRRLRTMEPFDVPGDDWDDWDDEPDASALAGYRDRLGSLTKVVLIGDQVVDVVRQPVSGSGYECAALELKHPGPARRSTSPPAPPQPPVHEQQLAWLARLVGGHGALSDLSLEPLPAEDLSLIGIHPELHQRLRAIDDRLRELAPRVLGGPEGLTAVRRLLVRAVSNEPALMLGNDRDDLATGAVVWAVAKGNDLVGPDQPIRMSALQEMCGLRSSPAARGRAFAHAVSGGSPVVGTPMWGGRPQPEALVLGSPDLLLARFRRVVAVYRDLAVTLRRRTPAAV